MNTFEEVPANKNSLANRKPICGVGINDAYYIVNRKINGKRVMCPYYAKWSSMIKRCYSAIYHERRPTYIDCSVTKEWLAFSVFKSWMESQDWEGKDLDKDLLVQGNKVYSPNACIFVDAAINSLLNENEAARGEYKIGVHLKKGNDKFVARCCDGYGKRINIGQYDTEADAFEAYKKGKYKEIKRVALQQSDGRLRDALLAYIITE